MGPAWLSQKGPRAQKWLFSPPPLRTALQVKSLALLSTTTLSTPSVTISGMRERAGEKTQGGPAVPRRDLHYPGNILETRLERRGQWAPLSCRTLTLDVHCSGLLPRRERTLHHEAKWVSHTSCPLRRNPVGDSKPFPRSGCASENTRDQRDPTTKHRAGDCRDSGGLGYF